MSEGQPAISDRSGVAHGISNPTQQKEDSSTGERLGSGQRWRSRAGRPDSFKPIDRHMSARKSHAHQRPPETQESAMRRTGHWARASLGRLGWLVIRAFHASLLIGADLYLAGPSVESVRHGGADGRHLISENSRHSRCDDEGSRDDGHGHGVFHFAEYALP